MDSNRVETSHDVGVVATKIADNTESISSSTATETDTVISSISSVVNENDTIITAKYRIVESGDTVAVVQDTLVANIKSEIKIVHMDQGDAMMVSATGMFIVFLALSAIAVIISLLPHLMRQIAKVLPEPAPTGARKPARKQVTSSDDEAVAVAIALANHTAEGK